MAIVEQCSRRQKEIDNINNVLEKSDLKWKAEVYKRDIALKDFQDEMEILKKQTRETDARSQITNHKHAEAMKECEKMKKYLEHQRFTMVEMRKEHKQMSSYQKILDANRIDLQTNMKTMKMRETALNREMSAWKKRASDAEERLSSRHEQEENTRQELQKVKRELARVRYDLELSQRERQLREIERFKAHEDELAERDQEIKIVKNRYERKILLLEENQAGAEVKLRELHASAKGVIDVQMQQLEQAKTALDAQIGHLAQANDAPDGQVNDQTQADSFDALVLQQLLPQAQDVKMDCGICSENRSLVRLEPCGHEEYCASCVFDWEQRAILKGVPHDCPKCRTVIIRSR